MTLMKTFLLLLLIAAIVPQSAWGANTNPGQPWKATVNVVDDSGAPIPDAEVTIGYYVPASPGRPIVTDSVKGRTDTNGLFSTSGQTTSVDLFFGAGKDSYYRSHVDYELGPPSAYDPVKWSPNITMTLQKVGRPVAMYAKSVIASVPALDKAIGYDLTVGDWLAPYGKGLSSDLFFEKQYYEKAANDYYSKITVSFPNPGDGIQTFTERPGDKGSALRSPQDAPAGGYQPRLVREVIAQPGQPSKVDFDPDRVNLFRVRTVLDERGNVVSALYGKIYGDFTQMQFRYYLNPTANDRSVEFDPARNLLPGQPVAPP